MKRVSSFVAALAALTLYGCAPSHTVKLAAGPQMPAADGEVKVKVGKNNETCLKIVAHRLTQPDRVTPGATALVTWTKPTVAGGEPQNIGSLHIDGDMDGKLEAVTPLQDFDLLVTAEPSTMVVSPTGSAVFTTHITRLAAEGYR